MRLSGQVELINFEAPPGARDDVNAVINMDSDADAEYETNPGYIAAVPTGKADTSILSVYDIIPDEVRWLGTCTRRSGRHSIRSGAGLGTGGLPRYHLSATSTGTRVTAATSTGTVAASTLSRSAWSRSWACRPRPSSPRPSRGTTRARATISAPYTSRASARSRASPTTTSTATRRGSRWSSRSTWPSKPACPRRACAPSTATTSRARCGTAPS